MKPIDALPIRAHRSSKYILKLIQRVTGITYDKVGLLRWNLSCNALVPYCALKAFEDLFKDNYVYVKRSDAIRCIVERANPAADGVDGLDQSENGGYTSNGSNGVHIEAAR